MFYYQKLIISLRYIKKKDRERERERDREKERERERDKNYRFRCIVPSKNTILYSYILLYIFIVVYFISISNSLLHTNFVKTVNLYDFSSETRIYNDNILISLDVRFS